MQQHALEAGLKYLLSRGVGRAVVEEFTREVRLALDPPRLEGAKPGECADMLCWLRLKTGDAEARPVGGLPLDVVEAALKDALPADRVRVFWRQEVASGVKASAARRRLVAVFPTVDAAGGFAGRLVTVAGFEVKLTVARQRVMSPEALQLRGACSQVMAAVDEGAGALTAGEVETREARLLRVPGSGAMAMEAADCILEISELDDPSGVEEAVAFALQRVRGVLAANEAQQLLERLNEFDSFADDATPRPELSSTQVYLLRGARSLVVPPGEAGGLELHLQTGEGEEWGA